MTKVVGVFVRFRAPLVADRMKFKGITLDIPYLEEHLNTKSLISSKGFGIDE
jgi:ferrous iron transport protein B